MTNKQAADILGRLGREIADVYDALEDRAIEQGSERLDDALGNICGSLDQLDEAIARLVRS